jgi:hypothetical protein
MEWYFQALISLVMLIVGWLIGRPKQRADTDGVRIDNQIKVTNLANNLFNELLEVKREVGELRDALREEKEARQSCQERLSALESRMDKNQTPP